MNKKNISIALLFFLALLFSSARPVQAQSLTITETLQQDIAALQASPDDYSLRQKIIRSAQEMKPAPAIPAEARKFSNRAEYIIRTAKSEKDFADAGNEYEKALLIAPWVSAYYYNLGVSYEKMGQTPKAASNYRLYLLAAPDSKDAHEVRKQIDGLEYVIEKTVSWAADPATGCKIGWNNSNFTLSAARWSGLVVDGKAEGKGVLMVTMRGKDGKEIQGTGTVEMVAGLLEGRGALDWSDGHSYDGYFVAGRRNGKGVMKYGDGRIYDGEWKDDVELAAPINVDKVLGIPWGASEDEAKAIMVQRPRMRYWKTEKAEAGSRRQVYLGPYNDIDSMLWVYFYQGKMYSVIVIRGVGGTKLMEEYSSLKQGMSQRYGAPYREQVKNLDSNAYWNLGGVNNVMILINKSPAPERFPVGPFWLIIKYFNGETNNLVYNQSGQTSGKDY